VGEKKRRLSKGEFVLMYGMDGGQSLTHDRADSLELLGAAGVDKMAVEGPDIGVMASGAESGHIESDPQVTVPGFGQGDFSLALEPDGCWRGSRPAMASHCLARMSSGKTSRSPRSWMALAAAIPVALTSSLKDSTGALHPPNEVEDLAAQVLDLSVEVGDALVPASDQEVGCRRGLLRRMELVLGLGAELVQRCDVARAGADGQVVGALPRREKGMRWANGATPRHRRHRSCAGLHRLGEAFGGLGVNHHAGQPSEDEVILASGL